MKKRIIGSSLVIIVVLIGFGFLRLQKGEERELSSLLMENRTDYIGDSSKVVTLIDLVPIDNLNRKEVSLNTAEQPYGLEVIYDASGNITEEKLSKAIMNHGTLLLTLIGNADYITYTINELSNDTSSYTVTREDVSHILDGQTPNSLSKEKLTELIKKLGIES